MGTETRILIVDDEIDLTDLLCYQLERQGFKTESVNDPFSALTKIREFNPNLVLLDVMMPDLDGYQILRMIRTDKVLTLIPVIMLTAKAGVESRIKGLEYGADDYLGKPFDIKELVLRIGLILKRNSEKSISQANRIVLGNIVLDEEDYKISIDGDEKFFTVTEFKLLQYFLKRKGRVQTRDNLLIGVWNFDTEIETRTVDVHIRRVRQKIKSANLEIEAIRGIGYRLVDKK